jgi:flagellar protein FliS
MFSSVASRSASAYKRVSVETSVDNADPHHLVSLLFDALQQALAGARQAIQQGDIPTKVKQIGTAMRILEEGLKAPLNLQEGGELAANLNDLYDYCVRRVILANARNDASALEEVSNLIGQVASGWKQINGQRPAYLQPV